MSAGFDENSTLTPDQAVREVLRLEQRAGALLQRTVGLTWMIWAIVNCSIFVSYEAITFAAPTGSLALAEFGLAWLPWMVLGLLATLVLWRSLELLQTGAARAGVGVTVVAVATFLLLTIGGAVLLAFRSPSIDGFAVAMVAVGAATALVGGSGLTTRAGPERRFWIGGGIALAVLAIAVVLVSGAVGYDAAPLLLVLAPATSTTLLIAGGLYTLSQ